MTHHKKVIVLKKPKTELWRFFDFTYANGNKPIDDWHNTLSDYGKQFLSNLLKNYSKIELPIHWEKVKFLRGSMVGIWEIRFDDGVQQRLLGIFDGAKRAVFLIGCSHKGGNYTPTDALETGRKRMGQWESGDCIKTNERQITTD
ncbi:MAG TPA: hypothetical protein VGS59_12920 [Candidatus Acidoferrales bacterium]|nr:hypothetical protein [Candidatus Acidoferrales bacterium]